MFLCRGIVHNNPISFINLRIFLILQMDFNTYNFFDGSFLIVTKVHVSCSSSPATSSLMSIEFPSTQTIPESRDGGFVSTLQVGEFLHARGSL